MKLISIIILTIITISGFSQKSKYETANIKVNGVCGMCEDRIENALDVVGIRGADWDVESKMLNVVFNPEKISLNEIHQLCANVGHSTEKLKADPAIYNKLHGCCKYEDPEVIKSHK